MRATASCGHGTSRGQSRPWFHPTVWVYLKTGLSTPVWWLGTP